jgi:hypothetical protein
MGNILNKFGCSKHLEFPNGVVVNDRQEIFISDNRAHCVKVFNYDGVYIRQIGGEGITNYPIGVGINAEGEVTIADNHNNFNLTVFSQDGTLLSALVSKNNWVSSLNRILLIKFIDFSGEQSEACPMLRRISDGRRVGGIGQQRLPPLHLQILATTTNRNLTRSQPCSLTT